MELYARAGFRGTGLTAIGEKAGVSHAAVLYHFGSARNLLLAVLEERDRRQEPRFIEAFAEGGLAALRNLPEVARINQRFDGYARLYTVLQVEHLEGDPDVNAYYVKRSRWLRRALSRIIREGQARGEIRSDVVPRDKASEIMAFMEGAQLMALLDPGRVKLVHLFETYTGSLVREVAI